MALKIVHARLILPYGMIDNAWLACENGLIMDFGAGEGPDMHFAEVIDAKGMYLSPGFIDLHVHGGAGCDFRDGVESAYVNAMRAHLAGGTTTMLATLSTDTRENMLRDIRLYQDMQRREPEISGIPHMAGMHLEGPYFSDEQRGAQDKALIRNPDPDEYEAILSASPCVKRWSIACELPGALELAAKLRARGITVSVGHSNATTAQVYDAFAQGFTSVTHLYSGCSVIHRNGPFREGGVVEAAFLIDDMDVEIIADGVHLPPDFLRLIYKIKGPEHIALITDSIRAGAWNVPDGTVVYDGPEQTKPLYIESGVAIMPDRKSFAGSIATTSRLVRTMVQKAGVELCCAVRMAALTPARMMGWDARIGSIARGKQADLLLLDNEINVREVFLSGKRVCI